MDSSELNSSGSRRHTRSQEHGSSRGCSADRGFCVDRGHDNIGCGDGRGQGGDGGHGGGYDSSNKDEWKWKVNRSPTNTPIIIPFTGDLLGPKGDAYCIRDPPIYFYLQICMTKFLCRLIFMQHNNGPWKIVVNHGIQLQSQNWWHL